MLESAWLGGAWISVDKNLTPRSALTSVENVRIPSSSTNSTQLDVKFICSAALLFPDSTTMPLLLSYQIMKFNIKLHIVQVIQRKLFWSEKFLLNDKQNVLTRPSRKPVILPNEIICARKAEWGVSGPQSGLSARKLVDSADNDRALFFWMFVVILGFSHAWDLDLCFLIKFAGDVIWLIKKYCVMNRCKMFFTDAFWIILMVVINNHLLYFSSEIRPFDFICSN